MKKEKIKNKVNIGERVIKEIKGRHIKMKPRIYFLIGSLSLSFGLFLSTVFSIFLVNLISFKLRIYGSFGYLRFGKLGYGPFLSTFPWIILLLAIATITGGIMILRKHDISYQKSFIVIVIGLISLVLVFGFLADKVGINDRLNKLPPAKKLYEKRLMGQNWLIGEILNVKDEQLLIKTLDEKEVIVNWDKKTLLRFEGNLEVGQIIKAVGKWQDDEFVAQGIMAVGLSKEPKGYNREFNAKLNFLNKPLR